MATTSSQPGTGTRRVTRAESKALSRARLLDAALHILDAEGEAGLTTTNVTRRAGMAQSSFYVHFADMDDLVHSLVDSLAAERRRLTRVARQELRFDPCDRDLLRETFRVPMNHSLAHPQAFRLLLRAQLESGTTLGAWAGEVTAATRDALIEDLHAGGMPKRTAAQRRRAAMVADGIMALTNAMILGHLEGRYPDIEETIDVLVAFSEGYFPLLEDRTAERT